MNAKKTAKQEAHEDMLRMLNESFTYNDYQAFSTQSADIPQNLQTIEMIDLKEQFVSRICQHDEPGFEMLITPRQIKKATITPLGQMFYSLLNANPFQPMPLNYELGEQAKLFDKFAMHLELLSFSAFVDPSHRQQPSFPTPGEFVNGFIDQIRKVARSPAFKKKCEDRDNDYKTATRQMLQLIALLSKRYPLLCGQWITLEYQSQMQAKNPISLLKSDTHFLHFRDGLQDLGHQVPSVGQCWIRQHIRETGYRMRMLLLYAPNALNTTNEWLAPLADLWLKCTDQCGQFVPGGYWFGQKALETDIKKRMHCEKYLRLKRDPDHPHFGCFDSSFSASVLPNSLVANYGRPQAQISVIGNHPPQSIAQGQAQGSTTPPLQPKGTEHAGQP